MYVAHHFSNTKIRNFLKKNIIKKKIMQNNLNNKEVCPNSFVRLTDLGTGDCKIAPCRLWSCPFCNPKKV
jgi:hypothetical protein